MQQKKSLIRIVVVVGALLLIPLIAMQFTNQVDWDVSDFMIMGALLFITGSALEFILKKSGNRTYRVIGAIAIIMLFLLIWAELAVGVFGTPWAGS